VLLHSYLTTAIGGGFFCNPILFAICTSTFRARGSVMVNAPNRKVADSITDEVIF
jgi:hypothetical protein